jgi:hypothetical protein
MPKFIVKKGEKNKFARLQFSPEERLELFKNAIWGEKAILNIPEELTYEEQLNIVIANLKEGISFHKQFNESNFESNLYEFCGQNGFYFRFKDDVDWFTDSVDGSEFIFQGFSPKHTAKAMERDGEIHEGKINIYSCKKEIFTSDTLAYQVFVNGQIELTHEIILTVKKQKNGEVKITPKATSFPHQCTF